MPVKFYLYPVPNKKNEFPIRVSISIGKSRYMTGIGYNCTKEAWEDGLRCTKKVGQVSILSIT